MSRIIEPYITQHSIWKIDERDEKEILFEDEFSRTIAAIANGDFNNLESMKKPKVKPLREPYFENPLYNPSISTVDLNNAYESYTIEEKKHWKQRGTKFLPHKKSVNHMKDREKYTFEPDKPYPLTSVDYFERKSDYLPFSRLKTKHIKGKFRSKTYNEVGISF